MTQNKKFQIYQFGLTISYCCYRAFLPVLKDNDVNIVILNWIIYNTESKNNSNILIRWAEWFLLYLLRIYDAISKYLKQGLYKFQTILEISRTFSRKSAITVRRIDIKKIWECPGENFQFCSANLLVFTVRISECIKLRKFLSLCEKAQVTNSQLWHLSLYNSFLFIFFVFIK